MKNLYLIGHPEIKDSKINKYLYDNLEGGKAMLYSDYKSYDDAKEDLKKASKIVFVFPLYWYSIPGEFKTFVDKTFSEGFAFYNDEEHLEGKDFYIILSSGGPKDSYKMSGYNRYELDEILTPFKGLCNMTKMNYKGFYHIDKAKNQTTADLEEHVKIIKDFLNK